MNIESEVLQVNLDDIIPNRFQPRLAFDDQGIKELSDSIKEHGIIQPLVLRKLGNKFEIIAGERRYKAATMAGLVKVPAIISNIDDNKSAEVALVENVQRRNLSAIEEARSYKALLDKGYMTQEQLAKKMGLSQSAISNKLRLLGLDQDVQIALMNNKISERHARSLITVDNKDKQKYWLNRIISERLTVRQLDLELKKDSDFSVATTFVNDLPNIEDIKQNAKDIKPAKRSVESMMLSEDVMTEFTGAVSNNSINNDAGTNPNVISNLDINNNDTKFFVFPNENQNTPVVSNSFDPFASSPIIEKTEEHTEFEALDNVFATPSETPVENSINIVDIEDKNESVETASQIKTLLEVLKNTGAKIDYTQNNLENSIQFVITINK